jgi:hypothetical protein
VDVRKIRPLDAALVCYPAWWRERYGDEMVVVVEGLASEGRPSWRIASNLVAGALRARLRATGSPRSTDLWVDRTNAAVLVATVPLFAVLPLGFLFLTSGGELGRGLGGQPVSHPSGTGRVALDLANVMSWAIAISVIVAFSGWTTLLRGVRNKASDGPRWRWLVAALPGMALVGGLALLAAGSKAQPGIAASSSCVTSIAHSTPCTSHAVAGSTLEGTILRIGGGLLIGAGWLIGPFVLAWVTRRSRLTMSVVRSGTRVATTLATASVVMALASAGWGIAQAQQPVPVPGVSYDLAVSSLGSWWIALSLGFALLATVSCLGAFAARTSYRHAADLSCADGLLGSR